VKHFARPVAMRPAMAECQRSIACENKQAAKVESDRLFHPDQIRSAEAKPDCRRAGRRYVSCMDSSHIRPEQALRLRRAIRRPLQYVGRLRQRMELLGFPPDDRLYLSVCRAFDALQELHVRAHYCSCTSGVARAR
jgi:hypothetical protein